MNSMKRQKDRTLKDELPRLVGIQYATGDQRRNNSTKNVGMEPKHKQYPAVDVTGDRNKIRFCRAILHRNLESQVRESRQIGSGQTGDDKSEHWHFRNQQTVGKNPLEEWNSHHSQQKSLKCSSWVPSQKWQNDLFVSKTNHSISQ